jgi:hypothetical protein
MFDEDEICGCCGCFVGGGCPASTEEETEMFRSRHPENEEDTGE